MWRRWRFHLILIGAGAIVAVPLLPGALDPPHLRPRPAAVVVLAAQPVALPPEPVVQPAQPALVVVQPSALTKSQGQEVPWLAQVKPKGQDAQVKWADEGIRPFWQVIRDAAADVQRVHESQRCHTRYLDLGNLPVWEREDAYRLLSGHVNELSNQSLIIAPVVVPGTAGGLLRLNIAYYGWSAELWERLADIDSHYHARFEEKTKGESYYWPGGIGKDGKTYYPPGNYERQAAGKTVTKSAFWLDQNAQDKETQAALSILNAATQSVVPIVVGDWFWDQTVAEENRQVGYHQWLGIKDRATFQKLGGFDEKLFRDFAVELREALLKSKVTLQPRALTRDGSAGGAYYRSWDFRLGLDRKNAARNFGRDIERQADGTEEYIRLPNRLWATAAINNKDGKALGLAPNFLAGNRHGVNNDYQIHAGVSCKICHKEGGLQSVEKGQVQRLFVDGPLRHIPVDLLTAQQYFERFNDAVIEDRAPYEKAIRRATGGWSSLEYAEAVEKWWKRYEGGDRDLEWAAREFRVSPQELYRALDLAAKNYDPDFVLSELLLKDGGIPAKQFEEAFVSGQRNLLRARGTK